MPARLRFLASSLLAQDMKTNQERAGDRSSKKALFINQWPLLE